MKKILWTYFKTSVRLLLGDRAHTTVLFDTLDVRRLVGVALRSMKNLLTDHTNLELCGWGGRRTVTERLNVLA